MFDNVEVFFISWFIFYYLQAVQIQDDDILGQEGRVDKIRQKLEEALKELEPWIVF